MRLERCIKGTPAEMRAVQRAADKALGYPRRGVQVGGGIHVAMPETWDGKGECPPGWTSTFSEPVTAVDGFAYLAVTGREMALIDPASLVKLDAAERQAVGKVSQAEMIDLRSIANAAKEAEESKARESIDLGTKAALAITAAAGIYEIVTQFLN